MGQCSTAENKRGLKPHPCLTPDVMGKLWPDFDLRRTFPDWPSYSFDARISCDPKCFELWARNAFRRVGQCARSNALKDPNIPLFIFAFAVGVWDGDKTLQTKVGSAELYIQFLRGKPRGNFTRNMPPVVIVEKFRWRIWQRVIPTCACTATRFTSKIQLPICQRIPGNGFSRPSFQWACDPMCKSKLRESVLPSLHWEQSVCNHQCVFHLHHNVPPAQVIMNSNPSISIIDRNIRVCMTPRFCKRPLVNGKVASPKSIVGDTTASNNFSRKTKETCVFNKICLYLGHLLQATS